MESVETEQVVSTESLVKDPFAKVKWTIFTFAAVAGVVGLLVAQHYAENTKSDLPSFSETYESLREERKDRERKEKRESNREAIRLATFRNDYRRVGELEDEMKTLEAEWREEDRHEELLDALKQRK